MQRRPLSVTLIAWIFIVTGTVGLVYHLREFDLQHPFAFDSLWVALIRLLAIVAGIYILRGRNWARWLALLWMLFHVVLSAFHSLPELAVHAALLVLFGYFLLRPQTAAFFRAE